MSLKRLTRLMGHVLCCGIATVPHRQKRPFFSLRSFDIYHLTKGNARNLINSLEERRPVIFLILALTKHTVTENLLISGLIQVDKT
jgi:hypothetical protein